MAKKEYKLEGLQRYIASPARLKEIEKEQAEEQRAQESDPFDSHPSIDERIKHAYSLNVIVDEPYDDSLSMSLLSESEDVARKLSEVFSSAVLEETPTKVSWDETAELAFGGIFSQWAVRLSLAVADLNNQEVPATIHAVLEAFHNKKVIDLVRTIAGPIEYIDESNLQVAAEEYMIEPLLGYCVEALRAHGFTLTINWDGPIELVGANGQVVHIYDAVVEAVKGSVQKLSEILMHAGIGPQWTLGENRDANADEHNEVGALNASREYQAKMLGKNNAVGVIPNINVRASLGDRLLRSKYAFDIYVAPDAIVVIPSAKKKRLFYEIKTASGKARSIDAVSARFEELIEKTPAEVVALPNTERYAVEDIAECKLEDTAKGWLARIVMNDGTKWEFVSHEDGSLTGRDVYMSLLPVLGNRLKV